MANDLNMRQDIDEFQSNQDTAQQGDLLADLYFHRYIEPNSKKLEKLKKLYIKKYGFLDNYV